MNDFTYTISDENSTLLKEKGVNVHTYETLLYLWGFVKRYVGNYRFNPRDKVFEIYTGINEERLKQIVGRLTMETRAKYLKCYKDEGELRGKMNEGYKYVDEAFRLICMDPRLNSDVTGRLAHIRDKANDHCLQLAYGIIMNYRIIESFVYHSAVYEKALAYMYLPTHYPSATERNKIEKEDRKPLRSLNEYLRGISEETLIDIITKLQGIHKLSKGCLLESVMVALNRSGSLAKPIDQHRTPFKLLLSPMLPGKQIKKTSCRATVVNDKFIDDFDLNIKLHFALSDKSAMQNSE